jgi:cephalosporin-C deacetylase-like acetyl esterase
VDKNRIGATGASGGGNQTMWLTAMDERIRAAVPVVSVGTFESYILNSNCICELLPDGLTYTEEAGVLSLVAPRALKICNALNDNNKAFAPAEMLRSYKQAANTFELLHAGDKLSYQLFNTTHGYWPEIREAMLGWMDLHLKQTGTGAPKKETPFALLPAAALLTFPDGKRDAGVMSTAMWCKAYHPVPASEPVNVAEKRTALKQLLRINENRSIKQVHTYSPVQGWERIALETNDGALIPLLLRAPADKAKGYIVATHPGGKDSIPAALISKLTATGSGIILADLWGTGEQSSATANTVDGSLPPFHTLARSALWLGTTVQGRWVNELQLITQYVQTQYGNVRIALNGSKEAGVAALLAAALGTKVAAVTLEESPLSYRFDEREGIDFFSMAVHIPGIIPWGDLSLAAALAGKEVVFHTPVTMSGRKITGQELEDYRAAFSAERKRCKQAGESVMEVGR